MAGDNAKWERVEEIISAAMNVYTFQNDIALARIATEAGLYQQVLRPAKAFPSNDAECLIYGYGSESYYANTITSNTVRYARVDLISYERCEAILGRVTAPSKGSGHFCALGRNGADACNGE